MVDLPSCYARPFLVFFSVAFLPRMLAKVVTSRLPPFEGSEDRSLDVLGDLIVETSMQTFHAGLSDLLPNVG